MIVLLQRQLAPYRISVLNMLNEELGGELMVMHVRPGPARNRQWTIAWDEVKFQTTILPGYRVNVGSGTVELSRHVGSTVAKFRPQAVVLNGWDMHASWTALSWARPRGVPVIAWVASTQRAGKHRGSVSNAARRYFLGHCSAAVVPGISAEAFVRKLTPSLPTYRVTNAIDEPDLRALSAPPKDGAALFIGELSRRKGVDLILEAAEDILSIFPASSSPATVLFVTRLSRSPRGCLGSSMPVLSKAVIRHVCSSAVRPCCCPAGRTHGCWLLPRLSSHADRLSLALVSVPSLTCTR